ncbi:MAG: SDR family NAD(P)-dependent oxidoreductase [Rhizomicrobium sp.]
MSTHTGRVAVVTGAGRGIGQETAIQLARRGAQVALVDLGDVEETAARISEARGEALPLKADVSSPEDWTRVRDAVEAKFGRADILVNNAGIYPFQKFDDLDYAQWSKVLRINLDSQFLGAKAFVPLMKRNGWGRIVNIASNSIAANIAGLTHYMASKMGAIGFTRGLANDLGDSNITVNAVAPALTRTPGTSNRDAEEFKQAVALQSIKRVAEPSDIVGPILFLTSADAQFVTGQLLVVDGGMFKVT